jgi:hemoglobin
MRSSSTSTSSAPSLTDPRLLLGVVALAAACASTSTPPPALPPPTVTTASTATSTPKAPATLYERLGGKAAIEVVVDAFIKNVGADDRINHRFALADFGRLRGHLVDQVCAATGGPCTYRGGDMKTVHKGQRIDEAAWAALVEDLVKALDGAGVPAQEKGELLGALAGMHDDIVEVGP